VVLQLVGEVRALKAQLAKNSTNSSKPPSTDPPGVERPKGSSSGRKPGGQPGHKGHRRELIPVEEVDERHDVKPACCLGCQGALRGEDAEPVRRQVVELPVMKPLVIEYRLHALSCRRCGATTRAELPSDAPRLGFGVRLCAMVALLSGKCRLSKRTTQALLKDGFGIDLGLGSISNIEREMSRSIASAVEAARSHVRGSPVVHPDETSWRQARRNAWLWTAATPTVTVFRIDRSRGGAVARELLGASFGGIAVSDRFSGYSWLPVEQRQACWAHLRRDFQQMVDRDDDGSWVGAALLGHIRPMFRWWRQLRDGEMTRERFQVRMRTVERHVRTDLVIGSMCASDKTAGTCAEIRKIERALWTFVREPGVEPTNNFAERAIRPAVLWRKGSFGTHSEFGSRFVERILSVVASLKQQGRNALDFLVAALGSYLAGQPSPSLLPAA
jgi:transposase